jgi:hypothetical protein
MIIVPIFEATEIILANHGVLVRFLLLATIEPRLRFLDV